MNQIKLLEQIRDILFARDNKSGFFSPSQAAQYLDVSKSMIYKLGSMNILPRYKPTHGLVYFKKEDIDKWIESSKVNGPNLPSNELVIRALNKNSGQ